jgi:hypothetical protein
MVWEGTELTRLVMRMCHVKKFGSADGGRQQPTKKEEFGIWGPQNHKN